MSSKSNVLGALARFKTTFSLPTPWPVGRTPLVWFLVVVAIGIALQLAPRPAGWPLEYLFAEDGQVFLTEALRDGGSSLLQTYAGYLHFMPRSIALTCSSYVSPAGYVMCTGVAAALVKAVAFAIAWPVLAAYARSWAWGLAAASAFLFIPVGNLEVLGNITNLRWFLVAGALFALLGVFRGWPMALLATVFTFAATMSDPLAFALAPLALWRLIAERGWVRLPSLGALLGTVVHLLHIQPGARGERGTALDLVANPLDTAAQLLIRGPVAAQYGMNWTQEFLRFGVLPTVATLALTAFLIAAAWKTRGLFGEAWGLAVALVIVAGVLLLAVLSFPASYIAFSEIWSPSQPSRYSAFAALFLTPAMVLVMSIAWRGGTRLWQKATVVLVGLTLVAAVMSDGRGDPRHSSGSTWAAMLSETRELCSEGVGDIELPNVPDYEGWRTTIQCEWLEG